MAYRHGIYVTEQGTELQNLSQQSTGITFAIGTAPKGVANEPVLCATYGDAAKAFDYDSDVGKWTLCEAMTVMFGLYNVAPVVMVNVFDSAKHRKTLTREQKLVTATHTVTIEALALEGTIRVERKDESEELDEYTEIEVEGIEYEEEGGTTTLTLPETYGMGAIVYVTYAVADVSKVTADDVIGAVDSTTGRSTGLNLVSEVYSRFGYTVGTIIAPGWSHIPAVGQKMAAVADSINGHFSAMAIADIDTGQAPGYGLAPTVKQNAGFNNPHLIACYPAVKFQMGTETSVHHLSTHLAGVMATQATRNRDVPFKSPSNQYLYMNGMCNFDGEDNYFGQEAATLLNGQGIFTTTNFNGWKTWGNETSAYPGTEDPKDKWINVRTMFDFIKTRLVLSFWSQLDVPITRRAIDSVVNSANTYLNGLTNLGALLGGRVEFNASENTEEAIMSGQINFHCYITPPSPAREINFILQYDTTYLSQVLS